jgi:peptidyl-prolyl cis-trans isomerase SurA
MKKNYIINNKSLLIKFISIIILLFLITLTSLKAFENKILVKIENKIITTQDVENEYKYILALNKGFENIEKKRGYEISKRSLIKEKIKEIEILKNFKELKVDEKYLNELFVNLYSNIGIKNNEDFKGYLEKKKIRYNDVKKKIEIEALWNSLIVRKFLPKVKINQKNIRDEIIKDQNKISNSYFLSEILFKIESSDKLKKEYEEIKDTIDKKGFSNAALAHSISSTATVGGNLGWIDEKNLGKKIKNKILRLKKNEITEPIVVPGGFLILKVRDIKQINKKIIQDINEELKKRIAIKKNEQLNQFSIIHFNKVQKDISIYEL